MIKEGLTFDDVLLVPQYSDIESRSQVKLTVEIEKLRLKFEHPIIPANMKTIVSPALIEENYHRIGFSLLHRYDNDPYASQMSLLKGLRGVMHKSGFVPPGIGVSIGVKHEDYKLAEKYISEGVHLINVDVAHGDSKLCVDMCEWLNEHYPKVFVIAGNVATASGARRLWEAGADMLRVGVGNGSICTTRIETGNGVPQLTALMDVHSVKEEMENVMDKQLLILNDGGVSKVGDIVKALCFADFVMTGNMFAGCEEAPGSVISIDGKMYKSYVGSSTHKTTRIEGVEAMVPLKKSFKSILTKMIEGIQSGCSYQGVSNITDLKKEPIFMKISNAGLKESHAHDVQVIR